jgi:hypothetical protein
MAMFSKAIDDNPERVKRVHIAKTFYVSIRWINPKQREVMLTKCSERGNLGSLNLGKYAVAFSRAVIVDWEGLTVEIAVADLCIAFREADLAALLEYQEKNGGTLPYDGEDAANLYRQAKAEMFSDKIQEALNAWEHTEVLAEVARLKKASA